MNRFNKRDVIAKAVRTVLLAGATASMLSIPSLYAAEEDETASEKNKDTKIVVTGSRIKRVDVEGATPVVTITAEDIEAQGFTSVYDALQSLASNTGRIQGEQSPNSFTPNAQELNLRGFGAGRTLVLLNGRRAADNPTPFNNQSNFFNFSTIPLMMVEKIEVLAGGASAIYGSDAIAGVVNVILKKDIVDTTVSLKVGEVQGGQDTRLQASTGWSNGDTSFSVSLELSDVEGIRGWDVDYLDSIADRPGTNPDGFYLNRAAVIWNVDTASYIEPSEAECNALGLTRDFRPDLDNSGNNTGYFCGIDDDGEGTLRNPRKQGSIAFNFSHNLGDGMELFANGYYWEQETSVFAFAQWQYTGSTDRFFDFDSSDFSGSYEEYAAQRSYQPSEVGTGSEYDEDVVNVSFGARGVWADAYDWEVGATFSRQNTHQEEFRFYEEAFGTQYYLGDDMVNYKDVFGVSFNVWNWNEYLDSVAAGNSKWFYAPVSGLDAIGGMKQLDAVSEVKGVDFSVTGDLFEMEAGPAQFAAVIEYFEQEYDLTPDARTLNLDGMGWYHTGGSDGGGKRDRMSVGVETSIPVFDGFNLTVAGRYDEYNDDSDVGGKPTGMLGLTWDITDSFMFRANYGTSFRAPDMHYLFAGNSPSYFTVIDPLRCETDGACDAVSMPTLQKGEISLKEEEGTNSSMGFVFAPTPDFSLTLDWYKIRLEDSVSYMSVTRLLQTEFECQTGELDINSNLCQDTISRITRTGGDDLPGGGGDVTAPISQLVISPFNLGTQEQAGYDMSMDWKIPTDNIGDFRFIASYSIKTKSSLVPFPGDAERDILNDLSYGDVRQNASLASSWEYQDFGVTLFTHRRGSIGNGSAQTEPTGRLGAWITHNLTVRYDIFDKTRIAISVNNLFDKDAQLDPTLGEFEWPYFDTGYSNAYGRNTSIVLTHTF